MAKPEVVNIIELSLSQLDQLKTRLDEVIRYHNCNLNHFKACISLKLFINFTVGSVYSPFYMYIYVGTAESLIFLSSVEVCSAEVEAF